MTENIGYKLRHLREDNNMSVSDISSQSGVHPSQIESIEKGELIPSVATLVKLSRSLGVRLGTFLDGMESTEPAVTQNGSQAPRPTINLAEGKGSDMEHLKFYALAQNKADRNMEPFIVNVEYTVPDVELAYGQEKYLLHPGDSIYFDSIVPHSLSSTEPGAKARILAVVYTPY